MQIYNRKGLFVGPVSIDPRQSCRPGQAFVTHGHLDHVCPNKDTKYVSTPETKDLAKARGKDTGKFSGLKFGKRLELNGSRVSFHNAGHILGSAQVLVEGTKTVAVTSDFKMQDSLIQKGAEPLKSDILVAECTFGLPSYQFPERPAVYGQIGSFVKEKAKKGFVVLAGYSLGKAQELTRVVNDYAGFEPIVHESIYKNNEVYRKHGVKLGPYLKLDHNLKESPVLIMPPSLVNHNLKQVLEYSLHKPVFTGMATGWDYRNGFDALFPLSDHADFSQLMEYVKQSEPSLVITMHGFEKEFANYIQRRLGIAARPLGEKGQKRLAEFA
jgi:Cft2 family RNA processing exonuclease